MEQHKTVEDYIKSHLDKYEELTLLRKLFLECQLTETVKWGAPMYEFNGKNIAGLGAFKTYTGIWFHQGALLSDNANKLINASEGKTKALRQWRFSSIKEIDQKLVKEYILEAIENEKAGKRIMPEKPKKTVLPQVLMEALANDLILDAAFKNFTNFKQKEFAEYIESAKQDATKVSRLEKIKPFILAGIGLNDKYRK